MLSRTSRYKIHSPISQPHLPGYRVVTAVLYAAFALTGIGTVLPGTLLPMLLPHWHLSDAGAGTLLLSLFAGSSAGSLCARGVLGRTLVAGCLISSSALVLLLRWQHAETAMMGMYGLGLGTAMTSISLLQSRRAPAHRTREMARLNLLWASGAFTGPFLLLRGYTVAGMQTVLDVFAGVLAIAAGVAAVAVPRVSAPPASPSTWTRALRGVSPMFLLLIPLATGIETGVGSWLSTYSTRAGHLLNLTISTVTAFWAGLLFSRFLAAQTRLGGKPARWLLPRLSLLILLGITLLLLSIRPAAEVAGSFMAGAGVGPLFPLLLSLQLEAGEASNMGFLAAGCGAALFPLLTGAVSSWTGSLRAGMSILLLAAVLIPLLGRRAMRHYPAT